MYPRSLEIVVKGTNRLRNFTQPDPVLSLEII